MEIRQFVEQLAREAGARILEGRAQMIRLDDKADREVVTDLDKAVNAFILGRIQEAFPNDDILSEEDDPIEKGKSDRLWVVDPIDGTVNLTWGLPLYCVSIALWQKGVPELGMIFDPVHDETFVAERGKGATLNGTPVRVSDVALQDGMLLYAESYNAARSKDGWKRVRTAREISRYDREIGSLALMHAYVACGRADALLAIGGKPWDSAAGVLLVQEAGGIATNVEGSPWELNDQTCIAASAKNHETILNALKV